MPTGRFTRATPPQDAQGDDLAPRAIARAKQGDMDALRFLQAPYADDVYGYVNTTVQDPHHPEDITQNVFAKLMKAILRYEQREVPFSGWILRVARNAAVDHLRARRLIPCEEVRLVDEGGDQHLTLE